MLNISLQCSGNSWDHHHLTQAICPNPSADEATPMAQEHPDIGPSAGVQSPLPVLTEAGETLIFPICLWYCNGSAWNQCVKAPL